MSRSGAMERIERNSTGRAVISALVIVLVASVVATSLTDSPLRRSLLRHDQALLDLTGLEQRWDLFAPDPRRRSLDVRAVIRFPGGERRTWTLPDRAPFVGVYADHRWRKWMEIGARGGPRSPAWPWLARWLATTRRSERGRPPETVTVVGRWRDLRPPGARGPDRGPWRELVVYRLDNS